MKTKYFLRIETNSQDDLLYAGGAEAKAWERFHLIENISSLDNTVSFELISNKKYLSVDGSGSFLIFANEVQKGIWEPFYKEDEDKKIINILHIHYCLQTIAQPGLIDSEMGINVMTFDQSGSRLLTCEADKTIKIYKEDDEAVIFLNSV
jgi:WD40 repeat protein